MRAFVRVIYSSEGRSPAEVRQIMMSLGFDKVKGQPLFEGEVSGEESLNEKMEELHVALRGMELRYIPSLEAPADDTGTVVCDAYEALASWRALGIDVGELSALLDSDARKFRKKAMEIFAEKVEAVAEAKEKEVAEAEAEMARLETERVEREKLEGRKGKLTELLGQEGGVTYHELHAKSGYDTEELSEMLKELVESGKARAEQKGKRVVYALN